MRYGCNRRNGFSTETKSVDSAKIIFGLDLAGSVTDKTKLAVFSIPSSSIVFDPYGSFSGTGNTDIDVLCLGIDTVFDKLFNNTCWSFNDFTCCN